MTLQKQWKHGILTTYLPSSQREMGGLGEKLNKHCPAAKNTLNDLTSKAELLNPGAPTQISRPP